MIGIGIILPFLTLVLDKDLFLMQISKFVNLQGYSLFFYDNIIILSILLFFLFFLIKNLILSLIFWEQSKFAFTLKAVISKTIFSRYMYSDYEFHIENNSSYLIRNITKEMHLFVNNIFVPSIKLVTEVFVVIAILFLLIYIEPIGAFCVFVFAILAVFLFQLITKKWLQKWGELRQIHEGFLIQKTQEGISGSKEAKILGREKEFIRQFSLHNDKLTENEQKQNAILNMPPLWLEVVGITGLSILLILLSTADFKPSNAIPILGVFAAAGVKLMPSASRILNSIQTLRTYRSTVELIYKEVKIDLKKDIEEENFDIKSFKEIKFQNIKFSYPNSTKQILNKFNFKITAGNCIGILGSSGSGKTTFVDLLLGVLSPQKGEILIDGRNIKSILRKWQSNVGYVHQNFFLMDNTIRQNIAFGLPNQAIKQSKINRAIINSSLDKVIFNLPLGLDEYVGERGIKLSGGQMQRIAIARALYNDPSILIFDEATSALDEKTENGILNSIRKLKEEKTIIIISHRKNSLKFCNKIYSLKKGELIRQ